MYSKSQYGAWMLELANYFVKEHSYQVITISKNQSEMWLVNPESLENPIMLISSKAIQNLDHLIIRKHRESLALVFNVQAKGLNLSVCQDSEQADKENIVVGPNYISDQDILHAYPKLSSILKPSKNPDRSFSKAVHGLRKSLKRAQKEAQRKLLPVTTTITTIILFVFFLSRVLLAQGFNLEVVAIMLGAYYKRFIIGANQYWRLLTAGFLHLDFFHLLMNMIALRNLGTVMERVMGSKRFLITLLMGIIFGNAFVFILDEATIGLGISGGLFALMGALIVYLYETGAFKNRRMLGQMFNIILINVLISMMPGVSFAAHLGGFQAGVFLGFMFSRRKDWTDLRKTVSFLFVLMTVGVVVIMTQKTYTEAHVILDKEVIKSWYELGFKRYADSLARRLY